MHFYCIVVFTFCQCHWQWYPGCRPTLLMVCFPLVELCYYGSWPILKCLVSDGKLTSPKQGSNYKYWGALISRPQQKGTRPLIGLWATTYICTKEYLEIGHQGQVRGHQRPWPLGNLSLRSQVWLCIIWASGLKYDSLSLRSQVWLCIVLKLSTTPWLSMITFTSWFLKST